MSVIGDFNGWDGRVHPMRLLVPNGVWEIFIPDLPDGEKYKFEIRTDAGTLLQKSDPFGFAFEVPPQLRVDRPRHSAATSGATGTG